MVKMSTDRGELHLTDDKTFEELIFDTPGKAAAAAAEFIMSYLSDLQLQEDIKVNDIEVAPIPMQ
jgi:hypothetical protein